MNDINVEAVVVEVSKLSLKEGDILCIKIDSIPKDKIIKIKESIERVLPKSNRVIIMSKDAELSIIEKADAN